MDEEVQILFDGVEHAVDVFGNPQKQLMNFMEVEGKFIQIDVGEMGQRIGVSFLTSYLGDSNQFLA